LFLGITKLAKYSEEENVHCYVKEATIPKTVLVIRKLIYLQQVKETSFSSAKVSHAKLTYLLMYGAETFLKSCQLCSHSGNSQQF
jgi:hypothetical protein